MNDFPILPNLKDRNLKQAIARERYFRLREQLVALQSASEPHAADIDSAISALAKAQLAYKATHGLFGNNPIDEAEEFDPGAPPVEPDQGPTSPFNPEVPEHDGVMGRGINRTMQVHRADHQGEAPRSQ
jgi:hypothetical protein